MGTVRLDEIQKLLAMSLLMLRIFFWFGEHVLSFLYLVKPFIGKQVFIPFLLRDESHQCCGRLNFFFFFF